MIATLLAQATNAPVVVPVTGIEWIDALLVASPIVIVAVAIQALAYALAKTERVSDKWIPIINVVLGAVLYPAAIGAWGVKNALLGIMAGFGSTEILRRIVPTFAQPPAVQKSPAPKPPEPPLNP